MANKKIVVAGATGLVGNAALRHFGASGGAEVVALSRRKPRDLHGARHVALDLTDAACLQEFTTLHTLSSVCADTSTGNDLDAVFSPTIDVVCLG